jgi:hypothetical protein
VDIKVVVFRKKTVDMSLFSALEEGGGYKDGCVKEEISGYKDGCV